MYAYIRARENVLLALDANAVHAPSAAERLLHRRQVYLEHGRCVDDDILTERRRAFSIFHVSDEYDIARRQIVKPAPKRRWNVAVVCPKNELMSKVCEDGRLFSIERRYGCCNRSRQRAKRRSGWISSFFSRRHCGP